MTAYYVTAETPSQVAAELADDARVALGRVRAAWPMLAADRVPGSRQPAVDRPIDRRAAGRAAETRRLDRAAAVEAYRHGRKPSGTHPTPVSLPPVEARHTVAADLADLAGRMWPALHGGAPLILAARHPATRRVALWCTWCQGTGEAQPPYGWPGPWPTRRLIPPAVGYGPAWLEPPIACPRCQGAGRVPAARACPACTRTGWCDCDRPDVVAVVAMDAVAGLLDGCQHVETAADAEQTLLDAADLAERALHMAGPRRIRLHAECPVCGAREMHAEVASPNRSEWAVRCTGPDCVCAGPEGAVNGVWHPACPCGIATPRRAGRPHCWPARTLDGPRGLAHRLGLDLPGTRRHTGPRPPRRERPPQ